MTKIGSNEQIDYRRRRLVGVAALSVVAAQLGLDMSSPFRLAV
ncbi:MAG: hypothetical protein WAR76_06790 [Xanthobacteraceae bacterium]|jgi:hypothetical protein